MTLLSTAQKKLAKHKALIFDHTAHLLWRSHAWHAHGSEFTPHEQHRCLGTGYQEFIDHDDLLQVIAWLISPHADRPITFKCMSPTTGAYTTCLWRKTALGKKHWVVIGSYL